MSWRPDDWKNPHTHADKEYQEDGMRSVTPNPLHYEYEAGADAMLEARDKELRDKLQVYFYEGGIEGYPYDCYLITPKELDEILGAIPDETQGG